MKFFAYLITESNPHPIGGRGSSSLRTVVSIRNAGVGEKV